jgi:hypothetical protein
MKPLTWLNNLSLKASYGENGNESIGSLYAWQNLYNLEFANANRIGGFVASLENKDLSWEKNGMLNIGLEGSMFDSRLRFSIEYFNKKTTDMLLNYPMALSTGFTGYDANVGNMRNSGFEFMLAGTLLKTKDIVWNMTWMGTAQRNKVLKLTGETNQIVSGNSIIKEDYPLYTFYMPRSAGVDPATGQQVIRKRVCETVKTIMLTCGMYDGSGEFAVRVGMPSKSGVGGGVMSVADDKVGIGIYGPSLDEKGNCIAGRPILEYLSKMLRLHIFDPDDIVTGMAE